ncbi:MAG: TetR/AcrR family transcriptional regulator [Nocardioidaceae bacterium]|nr:TetR/AcrR family transcriptional regulator [Nocardioidaceae bacterium]
MTTRKVLRAASGRPPSSRRQEYSSSTRRALVEGATTLFAERGYAGTSLDEVVAAARVTKGALYHHFGGKLDLFEHVVEREQKAASKKIARSLRREKDPWERAEIGLRGFLEICQEPTYRRIVMQEAPVALGPERWQEIERSSTYGIVEQIVRDLLAGTGVEDSFAQTFATVFYGAMRSAGALVADAEDPEAASAEVEVVIGTILVSLRQAGGLA